MEEVAEDLVRRARDTRSRSRGARSASRRRPSRSSGIRRPESPAGSARRRCRRRCTTTPRPRTAPGRRAGRSAPRTPAGPTCARPTSSSRRPPTTLSFWSSSRAFSAKSGQLDAGSTTTGSSFLPRTPPFALISSIVMRATSRSDVSLMAIVPESECRMPTLMVSPDGVGRRCAAAAGPASAAAAVFVVVRWCCPPPCCIRSRPAGTKPRPQSSSFAFGADVSSGFLLWVIARRGLRRCGKDVRAPPVSGSYRAMYFRARPAALNAHSASIARSQESRR